MYIPDQGDIIWLDSEPNKGKEIIKHRPAFVLSRKILNQHINMAIISPITSKIRGTKLEVKLPTNMETKGAILIYQLRPIDFTSRNVQFIEKASENVINEVLSIAEVLLK
jgi:mRNA-degrading endonuclease toxin of MazEF toxin-antitoxin module